MRSRKKDPCWTPLQATPPSITSDYPIDRTILDRTILRPSPDVQGTSLEGETVLLDLSTGRYYTLNQLGSVIWEHCTGHGTISEIHAVLCDRFDVAPERALDDLVALVNHLIQEGLLQQERR
ncbi:MAG: PqqD family protein [Nitrospira sp.]|nr:MAG: PqqD family protein [Nitrospira sp.]